MRLSPFWTRSAPSAVVTLSGRGTPPTLATVPDVVWIALAAGRGRIALTDASRQQSHVAALAVTTGSDRLYPACID